VRNRHRDALSSISWQAFERLVADHFRDHGYEVEHCGTAVSGTRFDGGVDLRLRKDGQLTLVQCKHENAYQVEHNAVHQLIGNKINEGAAQAIVITSGEFTPAALRAASQGHALLIDGVELRRRLGSRLPRPDTSASNAPVARGGNRWELVGDQVERLARKGRRAEPPLGERMIRVVVAIVLLVVVIYALPALLSSLFTRHGGTPIPRLMTLPAPKVAHPTEPLQIEETTTRVAPVLPLSAAARVQSAKEKAESEAETRAFLERVPELGKSPAGKPVK